MKSQFSQRFTLPLMLLGVTVVFLSFSLFIVNQTEQALVLQFGKTKRTVQDPGLHIKLPFLENTVFYDHRLLDLDLSPEEVIASDQKRLVVDSYLRYKIVNPLRFYQTLGSEKVAQARLQTLALASLRRVIGSHPLASVLSAERGQIMKQIREEVHEIARDFGVEVVDVRIRHADLPKANSEAIYLRMESERKREAKEFRAQGEELAKKIRAAADKERMVILAEADQKSQTLYGEGDAEATYILSDAYGKDQRFFEFYRSLEAYEVALSPENTTFVISPTGDFFRYFSQGKS